MKKFIIILFLALTQVSYSQWEECNTGIYGGLIKAIQISGDTLFAGTGGNGVFYSTDKGDSWERRNEGLNSILINTLAKSGKNLFAGTAYDGIFYSADNGLHWEPRNTGIERLQIQCMAFANNKLFAGTYDCGLYVSTDLGLNWTKFNIETKRGTYQVFNICVNKDDIVICTDDGLYRSLDQGETWSNKNLLNPTLHASMLICKGDTIIAGTGCTGARLSTNNGRTWVPSFAGVNSGFVYSMCLVGDYVFIGTENGVYRSTDYGASWAKANLDVDKSYYIGVMATDGKNLYIGNQADGIQMTSDLGKTWVSLNKGLINRTVYSFSNYKDVIVAGSNHGRVYLSKDNGNTWVPKLVGLNISNVKATAVSGNNIFAGGNSYLYSSSDLGESWVEQGYQAAGRGITSLLVDGNNFFATSDNGVFLSQDNGKNWKKISANIMYHITQALAVNGKNLFTASCGSGIFASNDFGDKWFASNTGLYEIDITSIISYKNGIYAGSYRGTLYLSTDNGIAWDALNTGVHEGWLQTLETAGDYMFAGFSNYSIYPAYGVYISKDNGESWMETNGGLNNKCIMTLKIIGDYIFAGTGNGGIYRAKLSDLYQIAEGKIKSIEEINVNAENTLKIQPNPANDFIEVEKKIAQGAEIQIYSMLGEPLINVRYGNVESQKINVSSLSKGMYFIKVGDEIVSFMKL